MNFMFMPLYAAPAEGTLHFKIQIKLDFVILIPTEYSRELSVIHSEYGNPKELLFLFSISLKPLIFVVPFPLDVAAGSSSPKIISSRLKTLLGYKVLHKI